MAQETVPFTKDIYSLIGYEVIDRNNKKIGKVKGIWEDADRQPIFLAIQTGWLGMGRSHFVPAHSVEASERSHSLRLPYDEENLKKAPEFKDDADIDESSENRIYEYYRGLGLSIPEGRQADWSASSQASAEKGQAETETQDRLKDKGMKLKEERVQVGKRLEEAGGVRIRKVIRTEIVNQPVELEREEVEIERVPGSSTGTVESSFTGEEVFIPLRRERAEVSKTSEVVGEVRARKKTEKDKETISETVRKEDVEVEDERKGG